MWEMQGVESRVRLGGAGFLNKLCWGLTSRGGVGGIRYIQQNLQSREASAELVRFWQGRGQQIVGQK